MIFTLIRQAYEIVFVIGTRSTRTPLPHSHPFQINIQEGDVVLAHVKETVGGWRTVEERESHRVSFGRRTGKGSHEIVTSFNPESSFLLPSHRMWYKCMRMVLGKNTLNISQATKTNKRCYEDELGFHKKE